MRLCADGIAVFFSEQHVEATAASIEKWSSADRPDLSIFGAPRRALLAPPL